MKVIRFRVEGYLAVHNDEHRSDTILKIKRLLDPYLLLEEISVFSEDEGDRKE
jgi:hypothetical protein